MADFFEVKDVPELGVVRLRRLASPKDSVATVVYIDDTKLTGAGITAVKDLPLSEKVAWPAGLEDNSIFEVEYKAGVPGSHAKFIKARPDQALANGGDDILFTWMFDGQNVSASDFDFVVTPVTKSKGGLVNASGTLQIDDNADGQITVKATAKTSAGTVQGSPATFTITKVSPTTYPPLTFTKDTPPSLTLKTGDSLRLTVETTGGKPPYNYYWQRGAGMIQGQNDSTLDLQNPVAGTYHVIVTDSAVPVQSKTSTNCVVTIS